MLLVAGPLPQVLKFMQIVCLIVLPVLLAALFLTIYLHRRNKKTAEKKPLDPLQSGTPERVGYTNEKGEFILIDHSRLIREYKRRLSAGNARYMIIKNDLSNLREKYHATARYVRILSLINKNSIMENLNGTLPPQLLEEVNKIASETASEKKDLQSRLAKQEEINERLERQNNSLKERIGVLESSPDEQAEALKKLSEENLDLKERVAGLEYLEEVLEEKKVQINFLQEQLEHRVKAGHEAERQRRQALTDYENVQQENQSLIQRMNEMESELNRLKETESLVRQREVELDEKEQLLKAGQGEISYLQSMLAEANRQHEFTAASLADSNEREAKLKDELEGARIHIDQLDQRLQASKQMMKRIQAAISEEPV